MIYNWLRLRTKKVNIPLHRHGPQTHFKSFAYFLVQQLAESFHSLAKGGQLYATFFSYRSRNLPFSPALGYNSYEPCVSFFFSIPEKKKQFYFFLRGCFMLAKRAIKEIEV